MTDNRQEQNENDEDPYIIYTKELREGKHPIDFNVSSEFNKNVLKKEALVIHETTKRPNVQLASANISVADAIGVIDTYDRPRKVFAGSTYAQTGTYAVAFNNKPGERIPKAGAFAEAGVGIAHAELSVLEAEARGPNAMAGAQANALGVSAIARAELGSALAKAGPVGVKVGLAADTGVSVGVDGLEVKVLGCGFTYGPRTSLSLFGSEVSCSIL